VWNRFYTLNLLGCTNKADSHKRNDNGHYHRSWWYEKSLTKLETEHSLLLSHASFENVEYHDLVILTEDAVLCKDFWL